MRGRNCAVVEDTKTVKGRRREKGEGRRRKGWGRSLGREGGRQRGREGYKGSMGAGG